MSHPSDDGGFGTTFDRNPFRSCDRSTPHGSRMGRNQRREPASLVLINRRELQKLLDRSRKILDIVLLFRGPSCPPGFETILVRVRLSLCFKSQSFGTNCFRRCPKPV